MKMERMYDFGRRHFGLTNYFAGTFFNSVVLFIPTVVLWIEKINIKCWLRVSPRSVGIGFSMWRTRSVYRLQKNRVRLRVVSKIKIPFIFWRAFWLLLRLELHKWIWMNAKRNGTWEIADHSSWFTRAWRQTNTKKKKPRNGCQNRCRNMNWICVHPKHTTHHSTTSLRSSAKWYLFHILLA